MEAHDLGTDDATDILAVGFSATDSIGHTYGSGSQEAMDQILRLDQTLGRLFAEVDRRVGTGRTLVVLSADHGSLPLVETLQARGVDARPGRARGAGEGRSATRSPTGSRHADELVAAFDTPNVYLDLDRIRARGLHRTDVEATIEKALLATRPGEGGVHAREAARRTRPTRSRSSSCSATPSSSRGARTS